MSDREVQKVYEEFWKEIVENPDGTLDVEQVKKELYDFKQVMRNASEVFCELTGSMISKPLTDAQVVIDYANEYMEKECKADLADRIQEVLDNSEPYYLRTDIEELIKDLKKEAGVK